jgi:hypothetical protein
MEPGAISILKTRTYTTTAIHQLGGLLFAEPPFSQTTFQERDHDGGGGSNLTAVTPLGVVSAVALQDG